MTDATLWTLDELVRLVGHALSVDYDGAPSARVRHLPDRRLVRWYVTKGLVDRPAATNGRNALYGRRHLLQLVAIKRQQAQGHSLAEIQGKLAGATDTALERLARVESGPSGAASDTTAISSASDQQRPRFWIDRPAKPRPPQQNQPPPDERQARQAETQPTVNDQPPTWPLRAIELAAGVTLLVDPARTLEAEPDAVRSAAQGLLDLLVPATIDERSTS
jgi:DNA-binding transcriptional MerR regulator